MSRNGGTRREPLGFEVLEGRPLLSVPGLPPHESKAGIINALLGGASHEFVALALREIKNPLAVVSGLSHGTITHYEVPGLAVKRPNFQSGYTGLPHDVLALHTGGVVVLKKKQIELGAIVAGPFTTSPSASTVVFAINRGAGQRLGPYYAARPGITPDALVTVTVGPYGRNPSATITDLASGTTQPITSPAISVRGPTVRILLETNQLPSEGFKLNHFTFAVWTATRPNAPIQDVGSFLPEDSMVRIGVETNVAPTL